VRRLNHDKEKYTQWDDREEIERYLEEFQRKKLKLNGDLNLTFDLERESDQELLRILSELRFPTVTSKNDLGRHILTSSLWKMQHNPH
jgi:hypothetical protein